MAVEAEAIFRGSVVICRFPADKARPAIIIRSDLLTALSYTTLLPITTDLREGVRFRINIAPSEANGLKAASQVMVDWPQTVRLAQIGSVIGRIDDATLRLITRQVAVLFGIGSNIRPEPE